MGGSDGCDISVNASGITYAGKDAFLTALKAFGGKDPATLNAISFAKALHNNASRSVVRLNYSVEKIGISWRE